MPTTKPRRAFSYARFSSAKQADGYSLARQMEAAQRYCERAGLTLADEDTFVDLATSGYTGSNLAGELGVFISLVKDGRIPKGSVLIIENTDRLCRLPPEEATALICGIVNAGVDVVTLSPEQVYTRDNIRSVGVWVPLQVAIALAHEESRKKGERVADAWRRTRDKVKAGEAKLTKKCPFWLRPSDDGKTWEVKEAEADLVRLAFAMCIEGHGAAVICGKLHELRPEGIARGKGWQPTNLRKILRSRQVIGELQLNTGRTARKGSPKTLQPVGPPVVGYFPAIVSEADFYKVQSLLDSRTHGGGRTTGTPNLFNGLARDARDGRPLVLAMGRNRRRMLVSAGAINKAPGAQFRCMAYDIFEQAILSQLVELKPTDLADGGPAGDEVGEWSAKLTAINHNIAKTQDRAAKADDPDVYLDLLDTYARERKVIIAGLEKAKREATNPAADALGECTTLVGLLAAAPPEERDELRRRVRAALQRLIADIYVLLDGQGKMRVALAQVRFVDGHTRTYSIAYETNASKVSVFSVPEVGQTDLRKPEHVERSAASIQAIIEAFRHLPA